MFDVIRVVSQVLPFRPLSQWGQHGVYRSDVGGSVWVGDVLAKEPEVVRAICWIPVQFLPGICWVVHGPAEREGDGLCEVTIVCEGFEAEELLHVVDLRSVGMGKDVVDLWNETIDTANAVLGSVLLNWVVPARDVSFGGAQQQERIIPFDGI